MAGERILIIEDETKIARFIELELIHEGYRVELAADGRQGLDRATSGDLDLIVLDVMLPSLNGMEVLRRLRQAAQTPVIMLTAKHDVSDIVMGLDVGADDYITKPFAIEELLARIRTALKRRGLNRMPDLIELGPLRVDVGQHSVTINDQAIDLTKREYDLLKFMAQNQNMVLTREQILDHVWGYDFFGDTNVVDVYISYLRTKIDDRFNIKFIHTVRGVGYRLKYASNQ